MTDQTKIPTTMAEWAGLSGMPMHTCKTCGGTGEV